MASQLAALRAEVTHARQHADARRQQASRLASLHESTARSEARASRRARKLHREVSRLQEELHAVRREAAHHEAAHRGTSTSRNGRSAEVRPSSPPSEQRQAGGRPAEFWRRELAQATRAAQAKRAYAKGRTGNRQA